ncbi:MAG: hypothetical protein EXX96DRAFT_564411 [Benjaminiella poitrasii]|nr:MAG: hypothetical protein EXX96DRAFT_564411 [Benjaminiella poitrasii]
MSAVEDFPLESSIIIDQTLFLQEWHVRVTWIAFATLWVFWGLIWIVRSYFTGQVLPNTTEPDATAADAEASNKKFHLAAPALNGTFAPRLEKGYQVVKDSLFALLCVLVLNTFARGSTRAVMILAWFFVAFAVVWFIVELVVDSRMVRLAYTTIFFGLGLAILGLAFKQGFY